MNPFELMEIKKSTFTKTDLIIYDYIKNSSDDVFRNTSISIANHLNISQPSISRFCKKIGYDGFTDFMFDLYKYRKQELILSSDGHLSNVSAIDKYLSLIKSLDVSISCKQLETIAEHIVSSENVIVIGSHKSRLAAELFRYNLIKFGINCSLFDTDDTHEMVKLFNGKKRTSLVVFSAEGGTFKETLSYLNVENANIVLVSMNDKAPSRKYANHFVWLPSSKNQNMSYMAENLVIFSIFSDLLTSYVAKNI